MKSLALFSLLLFTLPVATAQDLSSAPKTLAGYSAPAVDSEDSHDRWVDHSRASKVLGAGDANLRVWALDDFEPACGTMRTYRVKRKPGSEITRPSGYTTCVPLAKFRIEEAIPKPKSADEVMLPSE